MGTLTSTYAGIPYPDENGVDDVPMWLSTLVADLDTSVILTATSNTARDTQFYNAPMGVIVVVTDGSAVYGVYVKTSAPGTAVWGTVWTPPVALGWMAITPASNVGANRTLQCVMSADNRWCILAGEAIHLDSTSWTDSQPVGYLPSQVTVDVAVKDTIAVNQPGSSAVSSPYIYVSPSGSLTLYGIVGSVNPFWIGLDGVQVPAHI